MAAQSATNQTIGQSLSTLMTTDCTLRPWAYSNLEEAFEYKLIDLSRLECVVNDLNDMGNLGWELAATWGTTGTYGVLKRRKVL